MRAGRWAAPCYLRVDLPRFLSIRRLEYSMTTEPESFTNAASTAVHDEALIKQLKAAIDSTEICDKAVALLRKRMDSRELSNDMLLRIIVSLARSTDYVFYAAMNRPPQLKRPGRASRSGRRSRRARPCRAHGQSR